MTIQLDDTTYSTLMGVARDLRQSIRDQAFDTEKRTFYSPELHEQFMAAGLYKMQIPRAYGGYELTPKEFYRVCAEIARGDMGTGWCFTLASNHALMVANFFPTEVHEEVFAGGDFRAAATDAPTTAATRKSGGWELNGRVDYCSGIPYSTHFMGQARIPGANVDGSDRFGIFLAPKSEFTRLDNWGTTLGLKSSGSHSIVFDGGFIPDAYMIEDAIMFDHFGFDGPSPGSAAYGNPMYSGRHNSTFSMSLAATTLGGGFGALDEYERMLRSRTTMMPPVVPRHQDADYRRWFADAYVSLSTAEAALMHVSEEWLDLATANHLGMGAFTPADDRRLAAIAREVLIMVFDSVQNTLLRTIGAGSVRNGSLFEVAFRDLSQAVSHANPQLRDVFLRDVAADLLGDLA